MKIRLSKTVVEKLGSERRSLYGKSDVKTRPKIEAWIMTMMNRVWVRISDTLLDDGLRMQFKVVKIVFDSYLIGSSFWGVAINRIRINTRRRKRRLLRTS